MASTSQNTTSNSTTNNHQETNTRQGSTTNQHSEGGSLSLQRTNQTGGSTSNNRSVSFNNQTSTGTSKSVTGSTGKVNAKTQSAYDKVMDEYQPSATVSAAYDKLQEVLNGKPGAFSSKYTANLENLYGQIMNRPGFSYNMNNDAMYNMYKDLYQQQGKTAMRDTVAQSAALTGGYNNSYATTAGSQAYQAYLERLNEMVPQLMQNAYNMYQDETNNMYNKANLTQSLYQQDYGQYRDTVGDWKDDRNFYYNNYNNERNFDYTKYNNDRNFTASEYWNQRNAEKTSTAEDSRRSSSTQNTYANGTTNNWSSSESQQQTANWNNSNSNTEGWSNSVTDGTSNTNSTSSSTGYSSGSGGSGGSKSSSSSKKNSGGNSGVEGLERGGYTGAGDTNSELKNLLGQESSKKARAAKVDEWYNNGDGWISEKDYLWIINHPDEYGL